MYDLAAIFSKIGIDRNYSGMDFSDLGEDLQGWESEDSIFEYILQDIKPSTVVEVGSWKGASVIHMAKVARRLGLETKFICVDTWLGCNDLLWLEDEWRSSLLLRHGYPSMFRQFIFNLIANKVVDDVFPLPMTSSCAFQVLKKLQIRPDAIYIDAGHEEEEVTTDLKLYHELLAPGGWLFGDDYLPTLMGVVNSVNRFCADRNLFLGVWGGKWHIRKPG